MKCVSFYADITCIDINPGNQKIPFVKMTFFRNAIGADKMESTIIKCEFVGIYFPVSRVKWCFIG